MKEPKVFIVTPIHNGIKETLVFIKSLRKVNYSNFKIIIIDDGSTDNSSEIISKRYPDVILLKGDGNLWWSGATNLGVEYALKNDTDYMLTINNDVEVDPFFMRELVKCAKHNKKSLIGSVVYDNKNGKIWYSGGKVDWKKGSFHHNKNKIKNIYKSQWLTGMGVLVPKYVFEKIGFYDKEKFPQYAGDLEFSMRARKNGFNLLVCGGSKVFNNSDSCGHILYNKKMTLKLLFQSFFSIKSDTNLKLRYNLYRKYAPNPLKTFIVFYLRHIVGSLRNIIRTKFKNERRKK